MGLFGWKTTGRMKSVLREAMATLQSNLSPGEQARVFNDADETAQEIIAGRNSSAPTELSMALMISAMASGWGLSTAALLHDGRSQQQLEALACAVTTVQLFGVYNEGNGKDAFSKLVARSIADRLWDETARAPVRLWCDGKTMDAVELVEGAKRLAQAEPEVQAKAAASVNRITRAG